MTITLGTNAGFVTEAPVADPTDPGFSVDGYTWTTKDTSSATAVKIIEIGWWCGDATEEANFEVGVYTDSSGVPNILLDGADKTNAKGTTAGWKRVTGLNIVINPSTAYWIAVQLDETLISTGLDAASSGGAGLEYLSSSTELRTPFNGGSVYDSNGMAAIYAVWEEVAPAGFTRKVKISGTFQDKPIKTKVGGTFVDKPIKVKVGGAFQ